MFIRTIYYVDVGNLPKAKAEEWMKDVMEKYKDRHNDFDKPDYVAVRGEGHRIERFIVPENNAELQFMVTQGIPFRI